MSNQVAKSSNNFGVTLIEIAKDVLIRCFYTKLNTDKRGYWSLLKRELGA